VPVAVGALKEPDGVKLKGAGMIKDSDQEYLI